MLRASSSLYWKECALGGTKVRRQFFVISDDCACVCSNEPHPPLRRLAMHSCEAAGLTLLPRRVRTQGLTGLAVASAQCGGAAGGRRRACCCYRRCCCWRWCSTRRKPSAQAGPAMLRASSSLYWKECALGGTKVRRTHAVHNRIVAIHGEVVEICGAAAKSAPLRILFKVQALDEKQRVDNDPLLL
jgi:hypothetical protein